MKRKASNSKMKPFKPNGQARQSQPAPQDATVLCFDVGGTGMKAMLVSVSGEPLSERVRIETPKLSTPDRLLEGFRELGSHFPDFDFVACGFPGVIKQGIVYTAANLDKQWIGFNLQESLEKLFHKPVRVANDAAVQGMALGREPEGKASLVRDPAAATAPFFVNDCYSWRAEGPVVAHFYPQFSRKKD